MKKTVAEITYEGLVKENKRLMEDRDFYHQCYARESTMYDMLVDKYKTLEHKNKTLENAIEYRKKKAEKNQEKANFIDKVMKLPGVMENGKINRTKVALYYTL